MFMWAINGNYYDLTDFIDKHPGGKEILLKTKDEDDITALFESYHAFSNKEYINSVLEKYKVRPKPNSILYDFTHYNNLCNIIKNNTIYKSRHAIKSTPFWLLIVICSILAYCTSFYYMIYAENYLTQCILGALSGFFINSIGFNVMHDGSHYGISIYPNINNSLSKIWNNIMLLNHNMWFYHHVYNHHSFTSIEKKDPDIYHFYPFMTKLHNNHKFKPLISIVRKFQEYFATPILLFFPGQFVGQIIGYALSTFKSKIFTIKIKGSKTFYDNVDLITIFCMLYLFYHVSLLPLILYFMAQNFFYHINVVLDHDMYDTAITNHYNGNDWLKIQVSNSGNFINKNLLWSYMFGGINYQIEHHLFPNMSNVHYPKIAPIVKKYCNDHNIPYNHIDSLYDAYKSFLKLMKYASQIDRKC